MNNELIVNWYTGEASDGEICVIEAPTSYGRNVLGIDADFTIEQVIDFTTEFMQNNPDYYDFD
jgi:hypothetical protein